MRVSGRSGFSTPRTPRPRRPALDPLLVPRVFAPFTWRRRPPGTPGGGPRLPPPAAARAARGRPESPGPERPLHRAPATFRMPVLPPPCPQPLAIPSVEAMEAPLPRTSRCPEPGPSSSTAPPQTSNPPRPSHYLLIDTQGVPYTVLVDEESQREPGVDGASAQKKCYSCPVCSRVFEYMSYLQRHSITHSEVKPFECDTCGKAFKRASHLARHHSIHRASGGRPHGCPLCPRRFRDAGELAQHSRVHSGERPFQCPHCPRRFMEQNTLQKHTRWKHP